MSSSREDFENGLDTRINQTVYFKKKGELLTSSLTFRKDYLRSVTYCSGEKRTSKTVGISTGENHVYCATATPKVCQKVLNRYNRQAVKSEVLGSPEEMAGKVASCTNLMDDYSQILKAYADINPGIAAAYSKLVERETAVIKEQLAATKNVTWTSTYINALNNKDAFSTASSQMLSSMKGLNQVNSLIELCQDNIGNFDPSLFSDSEGVPTRTRPRLTK